MFWVGKLSGLFSAALVMFVLSPSLPFFPPAEAIRSLNVNGGQAEQGGSFHGPFAFRKSVAFRNGNKCGRPADEAATVCDLRSSTSPSPSTSSTSAAPSPSSTRCSKTPDAPRTSSSTSSPCPTSLFRSTFPDLNFKVYFFDPKIVRDLISASVRQALEQPLNYARNYLADILEPCVRRVIYLDSDVVVVDDIAKLWSTELGAKSMGAPENCHAKLLVGRPPLLHLRRSEALLLQHRRDDPGPRQLAEEQVHAGNREVAGGAESRPDLRAGVAAAVPAGVRRGDGGDSAPVEPARAGRGQREGELPRASPGSSQPPPLERPWEALAAA